MKKKHLNIALLDAWRVEHKMSWSRFAMAVGVTRAAVSKWVCGKSAPSFAALVAISTITHIPLDKLTKEE